MYTLFKYAFVLRFSLTILLKLLWTKYGKIIKPNTLYKNKNANIIFLPVVLKIVLMINPFYFLMIL